MDTTPEEEANPVLLAFKKITTQLEKLDERELRAEERERKAHQREQALIEQQNKVNVMIVKIVEKANDFQKNMTDTETRTKAYLSNYFEKLPKNVTIVQRKEWGFDPDAKSILFIIAISMAIAAWGSYYFTSKSNEETISYQTKLLKEYEGNIEYLKSKIPGASTKKKRRRNS